MSPLCSDALSITSVSVLVLVSEASLTVAAKQLCKGQRAASFNASVRLILEPHDMSAKDTGRQHSEAGRFRSELAHAALHAAYFTTGPCLCWADALDLPDMQARARLSASQRKQMVLLHERFHERLHSIRVRAAALPDHLNAFIQGSMVSQQPKMLPRFSRPMHRLPH